MGIAALAGLLLAAVAPAQDVPPERDSYRLVTWSSLTDTNFSPLVQLVREAEGARWRHAESPLILAHAASRSELTAIMDEAHYAWRAVGKRLNLPPTGVRARLVYVYETSTWEQLGSQQGIRPDGLALQVGRDILLKVDPSQAQRMDRVAHELVHFRLREAYGDRLPLWLEEGLATLMGVAIARDFHNAQGLQLAGAWPATPVDALLMPDELLELPTYPASPAAAQAMGRQAAELVTLLMERVGPDRWPQAVLEIGQRGDWRSVLASGYGVDMTELKQMATLAAGRAARPWTF